MKSRILKLTGGGGLKVKVNQKLKEKINESVQAVLPITSIVLLLSVTLIPLELSTVALFISGAFLLIMGMGFFQFGVEMSMIPLGEGIGSQLFKSKKLIVVVALCFAMGFIITVAEPDLQVLANQVASIPNEVLIYSVAVGVGIFLALAVLRILFHLSLSKLLIVFYIFLLLLSWIAPNEFVSVAFDAGGVTTGPITVPFIMALGIGLNASYHSQSQDSFGLVAFGSIGPIMIVLLLGIFYHPSEAIYEMSILPEVTTLNDVIQVFLIELPHYMKEVLFSVTPIVVLFGLYQLLYKKYSRHKLMKMSVGFAYTMIGLTLFLTGVNVGFAPVGNLMGAGLAHLKHNMIIIPAGMLIGYYIVKAEPAVQILNDQVEMITNGLISKKAMNLCLSIGVSLSVGLSMIRVLSGISLYWIIIPGYVIALLLALIVPKIFVGIAFDSGGVASGAMTSTFLLPLAMGSSIAIGGNVVEDAFGVVALVALSPLITIQIMGLIYQMKLKKIQKKESRKEVYE